MYPLLESIRLEDGVFFNLTYHQKRMNSSVLEFFNQPADFFLCKILKQINYPSVGLYKCRLLYGIDSYEISFHAYNYTQIDLLVPVEVNGLDYHLKYADRSLLDEIQQGRSQGEGTLIVQNGIVTDTTYANIVCRMNNQWFTPKSSLLKGTQRQYLLDKNILIEKNMILNELIACDEVALINSMIPFERRVVVQDILLLNKNCIN